MNGRPDKTAQRATCDSKVTFTYDLRVTTCPVFVLVAGINRVLHISMWCYMFFNVVLCNFGHICTLNSQTQ